MPVMQYHYSLLFLNELYNKKEKVNHTLLLHSCNSHSTPMLQIYNFLVLRVYEPAGSWRFNIKIVRSS